MKKKIFVISAGRSDYDRYYPIINELNKSKKTKLYLIVLKAHLDKKFGKTINFIDKKFFIVKNSYKKKVNDGITGDFARDLIFLNKKIEEEKPNLIIVLGDRYEMLIGPVAALTRNIPVIHFYGGAVTLGATDELVRHAITKMSHYHFVLLDRYKKRLLQLGEEEWRIKTIGMHELKYLKKIKPIGKNELKTFFKFNFENTYILMTFHPVTLELKDLKYQLNSLTDAINMTGLNVIITYPNADPKHGSIIKYIKKKFKNQKKYLIIKNCGLKYYANIMRNSEFLLGNSSSGIVEAASFKIPAVNIGTRQDGKYKPINVIDTGYSKESIYKGIKIATSKKFKKKLQNIKNLYESKLSEKKIVDFIVKLKVNDKLLRKKFINLK